MIRLWKALRPRRSSTGRTIGRTPTGLCGPEPLEARRVLASATGVTIGSSGWSGSYLSELQSEGMGSGGYRVGSYETVPWVNVNRITIQFNGPVSVKSSDLAVKGAAGSYGISGFQYNPSTLKATWTLSGPIGADRVLVDLDGSVFGAGGRDYEFLFNVLPGDVDRDGLVEYSDYVAVDQINGYSTTSPYYDARRDLDGTGTINFGDLSAVLTNVGDTLPWGQPTSNDPPVITLWGQESRDDFWTFYGTVRDNDPMDNPAGWVVNFYGILSGRQATVRSDGTFSFAEGLGSTYGVALAQTHDNGGLLSNVASYQV